MLKNLKHSVQIEFSRFSRVKCVTTIVVVNFLLYFAGFQVSSTFEDFPHNVLNSIFSHANFQHVFYNMLMLYFTGTVVERYLGSFKFLCIYFICGFISCYGAGILNPHTNFLGASGAVFSIMALYPFAQKGFISTCVAGLLTLVLFFFEFYYFIEGVKYGTMVSHEAHLAGGVSALILYCYLGGKNGNK